MYFHLRTKHTKWLPGPYIIVSVVVYLWGNGSNHCNLGADGLHSQAAQLGALRHVLQITVTVMIKSLIKKESEISWRVWLMVALNGGVLLYCFSWTVLLRTPPLSPPCFIMWIRARRLFNSSFERRVDRGEATGGVRGEGLAGCLCCAVAGRPSRDSARLRRGETRQGLRGGLMPCNED